MGVGYDAIIDEKSHTANLTEEERFLVYEGNARRVFPRLDAALKAQGR